MCRWFLFFLSLLAVVFTVSAQSSLTPDLQRKIAASPPNEFLPVLLVLSPQVDTQALIARVQLLPEAERRRQAMSELQPLAEATQSRLLTDLKALEASNRARQVRPLWIINAIAGQIRAQDINDLCCLHAEIDRAVWDPPRPQDHPLAKLIDAVDETGWGLIDIHAPQVWSLGYQGQNVIVGVIDSGVDYNHPDLVNRIWVNPGEDLNGNGVVDSADWNGVDDDGNGHVDDLRGWDFLQDTSEVMDLSISGTQAAGIIAGDASGLNVTGIAPQAKIMALRCYIDTNGAAIFAAQQYAIAMGADLVYSNLVFRWDNNPASDYASFRQAEAALLAAGLVHALSIGLYGSSQMQNPIPFNIPLPAHCPPPWLHPSQTLVGGLSAALASGAYRQDHQLHPNSSLGPSAWNLADILAQNPDYPYVSAWPDSYNDYPYHGGQYQALIKPDVAAPTEVISTEPGGLYSLAEGSMASAAHTAGTLALLLSAYPQASPELLARIIMTTALDQGPPGKDNSWGAGRLDAWAAVSELLAEIGATLTGFVTDSSTGDPLDSASVDLPDLQLWTQTDSLGRYFLGAIAAGYHDVRFSRPGWDTLILPQVYFEVGSGETLSVSLTSPRLEVIPQQISASLLPGDSLEVTLTVHNPGTAPLQVTLVRQGNWTYGSLYSTLQAQLITGDEKLFGVEVAEGSIWVTGGNNDSEPNYVYRFSYDGLLLDTLTQPASASVWGWRDLAWDGQYLYGSSGQLIESLDPQGNPGPAISGPLDLNRALAYDPATDHFFVAEGISPVYEIDRSGAVIRSWTTGLNVQGLAWHPGDEDGCHLYLFSQDGPALLRVSKLNLTTGVAQTVLDLPGVSGEQAGGCALSGDIDPDRWCFLGLAQAPAGGNDRVALHSLGVYAPWLTVQPATLQVVPPGGTLEATVLLDACVPPATYTLSLAVQHNAPAPEVLIPVSLTVETSASPLPPLSLLPFSFGFFPCRPNPFNSSTALSYELRAVSQVRLTVWDTTGRLVATLVDGVESPGIHSVQFDGSGLASGIYFLRLQAADYRAAQKIVLLK